MRSSSLTDLEQQYKTCNWLGATKAQTELIIASPAATWAKTCPTWGITDILVENGSAKERLCPVCLKTSLVRIWNLEI